MKTIRLTMAVLICQSLLAQLIRVLSQKYSRPPRLDRQKTVLRFDAVKKSRRILDLVVAFLGVRLRSRALRCDIVSLLSFPYAGVKRFNALLCLLLVQVGR